MKRPSSAEDPLTDRLINALLGELQTPPPSRLVTAGERALLDFVGCARGGTVRSSQLEPGRSAETVASALGVLGSALDRDDLHLPSLTHPGSVIWPTVIALGSEAAATGDELLRAAIVGYEIVGRIARALGSDHRRHWHSTATAGAIGASAAAALILRLDAPGVASAVGHATSIAGGSSQWAVEGSDTKLFHRAWAASSGVLAARCAAAEIPATRFGFEAERGLFAATSSLERAEDILTCGELWVIEEMVNRFYASSGFCHAAIEAAASLAPHLSQPIGHVEITLPDPAAQLVGATAPVTPLEAWWSAPYAVCVTLLYGSTQLENPEVLDDPVVRRVLRNTTVVRGDEDVSIVIVDGHRSSTSTYKGHSECPLTLEELRHKCQLLDPGMQSSWDHLRLSGESPGVAAALIELIFHGTHSRVVLTGM